MANQPRVVSFLICDRVLREESGKISVINIWTQIHAKKVPVSHGTFGIYVKISNVVAEKTSAFKLIARDPNSQPLFEVEGTLTSKSSEAEMHAQLPRLVLPIYGKYRIDFEFEGQRIGQYFFEVNDRLPKQ